MATPHIAAEKGDFAPAVLMPGDPKRAKRMAEMLMPDARMVTDVRGMMGFTGTCNGKPLSIMGSGMGQPSLTIYATELMRFYDVKRIIRVGTCGGIHESATVGKTIVAIGAHTTSSMNVQRIDHVNFSAVASWSLLKGAMAAAEGRDDVLVGTVLSEDHFYFKPKGLLEDLRAYGCLGLEMEAAALYGVAAEHGAEALAVLTISDNLLNPSNDMTAEERETKFRGALDLAVAAALAE